MRAMEPLFLMPLLEAVDPPHRVDEAGNRYWYDATQALHRDHDLPAMIYADGTRMWYSHGRRHRAGDRPAVVNIHGAMEWYMDGTAARVSDGPTRVDADGTQNWVTGQYGESLHRGGDLPAIVEPDGACAWFVDGLRHRVDGQPAYTSPTGLTAWFERGAFHRVGGPAQVDVDGTETWYYHGKEVKPHAPYQPPVYYL